MLKIQEYLRSGNTLEDLQEQYGINHRRHGKHSNLIQFKYSQIDSPMGERIVQECRGIILDANNGWAVVARPFDKFFNYGEGHAAPIDWNTARVLEKLDGSLMILYHYADEWHVATSGMPDASGEVNGFGMTFAELFWKIWEQEEYLLPDNYPNATFMFELTSPFNRIIVHNAEQHLTLIGIRDRDSGQEADLLEWSLYYRTVQAFPLQALANVLATFDAMDPLKQEGYVVVDDNFNRVKVKHPGYVALHHMKSTASPKAFLEVIRSGEASEFIAHFPEYEAQFLDVKGKYDQLLTELDVAYWTIEPIENQKEFALEAVKTRYPGALFALRSGKTKSIREYLSNVNIKQLQRCLGVSDDD